MTTPTTAQHARPRPAPEEAEPNGGGRAPQPQSTHPPRVRRERDASTAVRPALDARSKHVDAMLAIGIVMVVLGHRYQPETLFFPAYTFHMALFFFISGYLATIKPGFREKLRFLGRKTRSQLLRYYQYNLFFGVVTWLLALCGLTLGYNVPSFGSGAAALTSVRDFFVVPFLDGHHYHLFAAAWFVLQLYLVHVVFQLVCFSPRKVWIYAVLAATIPVTLVCLSYGRAQYLDFRMTGVRTSFAFLFFLIGYVVKLEEARLRKILLAPLTLVACFALVNVLAVNFGNIRYNIVVGDIGNDLAVVPVATSLLIVLMIFQIAHWVAVFVSDRSIILRIGRSTMPIMVWHFSVFFAINALLFAADLIDLKQLSDNWFVLNPKQTWALYAAAGVFVPMLLAEWRARRGRVAAAG